MCFEKHNSHYDVVIGVCVCVWSCVRAILCLNVCVCVRACVRVCDLCLSFNLYFK